MKPITYFAKCGCKLTKDQTIRKKKIGRVCREHKEKITHGERMCEDCTIIITLTYNSVGSLTGLKRCPSCWKANDALVHHKSYVKAAKKKKTYDPATKEIPEKLWSVDFRGDYCRNLLGCMIEHSVLPCADCDKFLGVFRWNDPIKLEQFTI